MGLHPLLILDVFLHLLALTSARDVFGGVAIGAMFLLGLGALFHSMRTRTYEANWFFLRAVEGDVAQPLAVVAL